MPTVDVQVTTSTDLDPAELRAQADRLGQKAGSLRAQAELLTPVLARTYRRRAAELELEAWVLEIQAGVPADEVHAPAA